MSDRTLPREALDYAVDQLRLWNDDGREVVREDYEGRYNITGLGLVVEDEKTLARLALAIGKFFHDEHQGDEDAYEDAVQALDDMLGTARTDSMGRDHIIVYFPGYTLT